MNNKTTKEMTILYLEFEYGHHYAKLGVPSIEEAKKYFDTNSWSSLWFFDIREPIGLSVKPQVNYEKITNDDNPLWFQAFKNFGEIEFLNNDAIDDIKDFHVDVHIHIEDDSYYDFSKVAPREKGVIVKYKTEPIVEYCNIQ